MFVPGCPSTICLGGTQPSSFFLTASFSLFSNWLEGQLLCSCFSNRYLYLCRKRGGNSFEVLSFVAGSGSFHLSLCQEMHIFAQHKTQPMILFFNPVFFQQRQRVVSIGTIPHCLPLTKALVHALRDSRFVLRALASQYAFADHFRQAQKDSKRAFVASIGVEFFIYAWIEFVKLVICFFHLQE